MKKAQAYTKSEARAIADSVRSGTTPTCPRCGGPLDEWAVPPRPDVSYVRDRVWFVCVPCSRSVVLDRHEPRP